MSAPIPFDVEQEHSRLRHRCGTCRWHDVEGFYAFYKQNADGMGDMGFCRQRPPLPDLTRLIGPVAENAYRSDIFVFALWPETDETEWCGAWEARPKEDASRDSLPSCHVS
jgi:hypothetical protein